VKRQLIGYGNRTQCNVISKLQTYPLRQPISQTMSWHSSRSCASASERVGSFNHECTR